MTDQLSNRGELLAKARAFAHNAYAPYSRFRVGAAVVGSKGIYFGANVENGSLGLSLCAERVALSLATVAQDYDISVIAVACIDAQVSNASHELMPCGACRQWMMELAPEAAIYVEGIEAAFTVEDLLPNAFRLSQLQTL
jgi:cytidine deaminase